METWTPLERTGAIAIAICLMILNALSVFALKTQAPPYVSGAILTLVILFSMRGLRRPAPFGFVDALSLWVVFGAITIIPLALLLLPLMVFGGMWQAGFFGAVLYCLYVWLPTFGIMYLPGAAALLYLCWERAETRAQKEWLFLCAFVTFGYLVYDLWWFATGQKIQPP
jgi:nicotinamide riboside transporter PnuC